VTAGAVFITSRTGSSIGRADSADSIELITATTEAETTTLPSTTLAPTTTLPPTTTTTKAWPKGPVLTIPAAGAVPVISRIATADPVVFLTIDDGSIRDPRVPELLAQFKIPATLFVNQGPYLADPDYFARVIASGGSINSHTKSHRLLTKLSASAQRAEICGMRDIIGQHVFVPGHLFRAPFGVSNATTQTAAGSCGINAVLFWHATLNDGRVQYQQGNQLQPGDIVLTHFRDDLYDNIRALIWQSAIQGLTIAPIEDYLPLPGDG
jgi:peptidoglycan/xylan/chitin deacetylase (PgdA/CDA1 family)